MKKLFIIALLVIGCTDEDGSEKALTSQGFSDIQFTGYSAFNCSQDDIFATGFRARNPKGLMVEGTVCCGLLKMCTVRF